MKNHISYLLALLTILFLASSCSNIEVYDLTCEGLKEPLGIDSDVPHFL